MTKQTQRISSNMQTKTNIDVVTNLRENGVYYLIRQKNLFFLLSLSIISSDKSFLIFLRLTIYLLFCEATSPFRQHLLISQLQNLMSYHNYIPTRQLHVTENCQTSYAFGDPKNLRTHYHTTFYVLPYCNIIWSILRIVRKLPQNPFIVAILLSRIH